MTGHIHGFSTPPPIDPNLTTADALAELDRRHREFIAIVHKMDRRQAERVDAKISELTGRHATLVSWFHRSIARVKMTGGRQ